MVFDLMFGMKQVPPFPYLETEILPVKSPPSCVSNPLTPQGWGRGDVLGSFPVLRLRGSWLGIT